MNPSDAAQWPEWVRVFSFSNVNTWYVVIGCLVLATTAGIVGCFAVLRKRALLGDVLAHAALPGVCAAFMLSGTRDPWIILAGAAVSAWLGAIFVDWVTSVTRVKEDSAQGMALSLFFAVGVVLLTQIQKSGAASQAGLDRFLFGQAAALMSRDIWVIVPVGIALCGIIALGYKEFKIIAFDPDFAAATGLPRTLLEATLATLIVVAVVIGLQAVGVVLMAALLVTPAAAARYWTNRLGLVIFLSGVFGACSGLIGAFVSALAPKMPTGPWMVVAVTSVFVFSLLCAPKRGIIARVRRFHYRRQKTLRENVLKTIYNLGEPIGRWDIEQGVADILRHRPMRVPVLQRVLRGLVNEGLAREAGSDLYVLTQAGIEQGAHMTRLHRLWELYLTRKLEIAPDHVHDDAEEIEHIITPELEKRLLAVLEDPNTDPHGEQIPDIPPAAQGSAS